MTSLPPWKRTARRAPEDHWAGLQKHVWVEFTGYDDVGGQQGKLLAYLVDEGDDRDCRDGKVYIGHVIAVEDEYYEYWVNETYGAYDMGRTIPLHFCKIPARRCSVPTAYRKALHVDVFRLIEADALSFLGWVSEGRRGRLLAYPAHAGEARLPGAGAHAGPEELGLPAVRSGAAGIGDLAAALGSGGPHVPAPLVDGEAVDANKKAKNKRKHQDGKDKDGGDKELLEELLGRKPPGPRASELDFGTGLRKRRRRERRRSPRKVRGPRTAIVIGPRVRGRLFAWPPFPKEWSGS